MLLVDNVVAGFQLYGFRVVVMGQGEGLKEITADIHKGILKLGNYSKLVCTLGRADVTHNRNFDTILNRFIQAVDTYGKNLEVVMTGPLPDYWDDRWKAKDVLEAAVRVKRRILKVPGFHFSDASAWFADREGVDHKYMGPHGITKEGLKLLRSRLIKFTV